MFSVEASCCVRLSAPELLENAPTPLACDMTALSPEQRQRHAALSRQLAQATAEVKELPDGYAFRYETD
jgi:ABC-type nitrate/sulfonate/bicarbonate transport system substrate-binding protein